MISIKILKPKKKAACICLAVHMTNHIILLHSKTLMTLKSQLSLRKFKKCKVMLLKQALGMNKRPQQKPCKIARFLKYKKDKTYLQTRSARLAASTLNQLSWLFLTIKWLFATQRSKNIRTKS